MRSLYLALLILSFSSVVYMETCPAKEDIYPCVCDEAHIQESGDILVTCSDVSLNLETLKRALSGLSGKNQVDLVLEDLQLGTLPSNYFSGIGIRKLDFDHCLLDGLTNDGQPELSGLEDHLEELTIIGDFSGETNRIKLSLSHLRKLKKLVLLYNSIAELGDDWFNNGPYSLEIIELFNNNIKNIGSNAFARLNNLKSLALIGNGFGFVKRSMFPTTADKLEVLELDKNQLTDIPEDIFSGMPSVHTVSLRENKITTIEERTWYSIWEHLGTVSFDGNNINCNDQLNWIVRYKDRPRLYGKCTDPKEYEGMELETFLKSLNQ